MKYSLQKICFFVVIFLVLGLATPLVYAVPVHGQREVVKDTFALYYFQNRTKLDENYLDNREQMAKIKDYLARSPRIEKIEIFSYASPEGVFEHNVNLANKRAQVAKDFILRHLPDSGAFTADDIILSPMAENWDGFYEVVTDSYHRHDREKVLKILEDNSVGNPTKKWRLQQLDGGYTWNYLIRNQMPRLRMATWICVWEKPENLAAIPSRSLDSLVAPSYSIHPPIIQELEIEERTVLALKTNLLYDAVSALNAEIELPVGDKFSVMLEDVFPWWSGGPNNRKYAFQMWEMGIEPRWWFKKSDSRDQLAGHFLGLYAMSSIYDFQYDRDLCYQGEYWSAGLTYGFALPISKLLNMEFSLSVGFLQSDYRHYQPDPDYEHLFLDKYNTGTLSYFGPTKLKVSLVLPITVKYQKRR